jgi:hypothetical protein
MRTLLVGRLRKLFLGLHETPVMVVDIAEEYG